MSPRQLRVRAGVRFAVLVITIAAWLVLAHAIPAVLVVGL